MKRLALVVFVLILLGAGAAGWFYVGTTRPFKGYGASELFVEIPSGSGSIAIGKRLADAGVVRDASTFRLALWLTGDGRGRSPTRSHAARCTSVRSRSPRA
jgi:cell division protein YceG involved in septum cleavage